MTDMTYKNVKKIKLPDGSEMPKLGQGTWQMAEDDSKREREIAPKREFLGTPIGELYVPSPCF